MTLGEYPDKVPPQYLIPIEPLPLQGSTWAGSRTWRRAAGLGVAGPEPGRRQHLRRLQRRWPARPVHDLARRRPGRLAVRQPGRRHVRGPVRLGRAGRPGLRPERHPGRLRQRRRPRRAAAARRLGEAAAALAPEESGATATFDDVTVAAGLGEPIATESAAWGDYDNDGWSTCSSAASTCRPACRAASDSSARPAATAAGSTTTRATARS